jgi:hypothetical protein
MLDTIIKLALLSFELVIFGIMIGPLVTTDWLYQGDEVTWHGSLSQVTDGPDIWEGEEYLKLYDEYCDWYNSGNYTYQDGTYALCVSFYSLYAGGVAYIFFSSLAMGIWLGKLIVLIIMFWREDRTNRYKFVAIITPVISIIYAIGYAIWVGNSKVNFQGLCDDLYEGDSQAEACGDTGAKYGLASVVFNVCYAPLFIVVIVKKWYVRKESCSRPPEGHPELEMNSLNSPQALSAQPVQQSNLQIGTVMPFDFNDSVLINPDNMGEVAIGYPVEQPPENNQEIRKG